MKSDGTRMTVKDISIDTIGLSTRARNAFHQAQVHTVGEMMEYTEESLSQMANLGKKSVQEILAKIEEYRALEVSPESEKNQPEMPGDFEVWMQEPSGREQILSWLQETEVRVEALELLSARAFNLLLLSGNPFLHQIAFRAEQELMERMKQYRMPSVLVINKIDTVKNEDLLAVIAAYSETHTWDAVVPLSAKTGENCDILFEEFEKFAIEGPQLFPDDMLCDQPERQLVAEIILSRLQPRHKVGLFLRGIRRRERFASAYIAQEPVAQRKKFKKPFQFFQRFFEHRFPPLMPDEVSNRTLRPGFSLKRRALRY